MYLSSWGGFGGNQDLDTVRLCNRKTSMSSGDYHPTPPGSQMGFAAVDTISANDKPVGEILSCILQHEETGIPLVVRGLSADPNWSPLPGLTPSEEEGNPGRRSPGRQINLPMNVDDLIIAQLVPRTEGMHLSRRTSLIGSINFRSSQGTYCPVARKKHPLK
jgi:hypothetical protein